jgi:hypothetical protein
VSSKSEKDHQARGDELYQALGYALDSWGRLEHSLAVSFSSVLRTDQLLAVPVYFSASSFRAKYKMLNVAAAYGMKRWENDEAYCAKTSFAADANKQALKWSDARNKLAHERIAHLHDYETGYVGGAVSPNFVGHDGRYDYLTTQQIRHSADRFRALSNLILKSHFAKSLEEYFEYRRELDQLPKVRPYDNDPGA